jgi:hypothetical protein
MDKCFIIQPFNEKFNQRFEEIFKPAILEAGLQPYRVDQDLTSRVLIESIEKGIKNSLLCFADISTDNPNVWYELGFAVACKKDVIMVCSDERVDKFPFDISHKQVIKYSTNSLKGFQKLIEAIVTKINAYSPPSSRKFLRPASQGEWLAVTDKKAPQWACYQEILKNYDLKKISCQFKTNSPYFRFGYKLTESNGNLFGDTIIKTKDPNLIIHVGKNVYSSSLFLATQYFGVGDKLDEPIFKFINNKWIQLDLEISSDNILKFYVQNKLMYNIEITPEIRKRLFMVAWGDSCEYKILVEKIRVEAN